MHAKITQTSKQLIAVRPNSVDSMVFADVQTLEGARACIATFFQLLLDTNLQLRETYTQIEDYKSHLESVLAEVEQLNSERRQEERQRELEIQSLHQEYLDKERMLVQLVMQKTGVNTEMEASEENPLESINLLDLIDLLIKQLHAAQAPHEGMITEHEKELLSKSTSEGLKRALNAKVEHREQKKEQYNATKAAISKRNVELEKKTLEQDIALKRLEKQLDTANTEKNKFKRLYEEEKRKRGHADEPGGQQVLGNSNSLGAPHSYKEARMKKKMAKAGNSVTSLPTKNNSEVITGSPHLKQGAEEEEDHGMVIQDGQEALLAVPEAPQTSDVFKRLHERTGKRQRFIGISPRGGPEPPLLLTQSQRSNSAEFGPAWQSVHDKHDAHKS